MHNSVKKNYMNLKIIETSFIPLFLATLIVVAFNWQFSHIYTYLIEHFTQEKLSVLYAHLFIYTFLSLSIFIFFINISNHFLLKSRVFVSVSILMLLIFYALSHNLIGDALSYFIKYPFSSNSIMGIVLFVVGTFSFALYSLGIQAFGKFIPLSYSFIFVILALLYSAGFIHTYCYPISEIMTKF